MSRPQRVWMWSHLPLNLLSQLFVEMKESLSLHSFPVRHGETLVM